MGLIFIFYSAIYAAIFYYCIFFWYASVRKYSKSVYGKGFKYVLIGHLLYFGIFCLMPLWMHYLPQRANLILGGVLIPIYAASNIVSGGLSQDPVRNHSNFSQVGLIWVIVCAFSLIQFLYAIPIYLAVKKDDARAKPGVGIGLCVGFFISIVSIIAIVRLLLYSFNT